MAASPLISGYMTVFISIFASSHPHIFHGTIHVHHVIHHLHPFKILNFGKGAINCLIPPPIYKEADLVRSSGVAKIHKKYLPPE
jgi:hypothetical protein